MWWVESGSSPVFFSTRSGGQELAFLWGSGLSLCWVLDSLLPWDRCVHSSPMRNPRPEAVAAVLWSARLDEWRGRTRGTGSVTADRDSTARGCPAVGLRLATRPAGGGRDARKVAGNREGQTAPASQLGHLVWGTRGRRGTQRYKERKVEGRRHPETPFPSRPKITQRWKTQCLGGLSSRRLLAGELTPHPCPERCFCTLPHPGAESDPLQITSLCHCNCVSPCNITILPFQTFDN